MPKAFSALLLFIFLLLTGTFLHAQRHYHYQRIKVDMPETVNNRIYEHQVKPPQRCKTDKSTMNNFWKIYLFIIFLICLVALVCTIVLGFADPASIYFAIFSIIAGISFLAGLIPLIILLTRKP